MSDYQVMWHSELGHFPDEDSAIAAAWTITPPGGHRPKVIPTGALQVRTEDPSPHAHPDPAQVTDASFVQGTGGDTVDPVKHTLYPSRSGEAMLARTHCDLVLRPGFYRNADLDTEQCPSCAIVRNGFGVKGARVVDHGALHLGVHIVERWNGAGDPHGLRFIQTHCGRIADPLNCQRITLEPPPTAQCASCFNGSPHCPIKPAGEGW